MTTGAEAGGQGGVALDVAAAGERLTVHFRLAGRPVGALHATCRSQGLVKLRARL